MYFSTLLTICKGYITVTYAYSYNCHMHHHKLHFLQLNTARIIGKLGENKDQKDSK